VWYTRRPDFQAHSQYMKLKRPLDPLFTDQVTHLLLLIYDSIDIIVTNLHTSQAHNQMIQ